MGHGGADGELPHLKDRIQDVVHKAFWDEVSETLSNPSAAVQIPRLRRLYEDIHEAIKPLMPANHPIRLILTCPLSPTSFPLRSALTHFRELLVCLRSRCAPIRDAHIDALIRNVDDLPSLASIPDMAKLVADTVRSILELAELMKEDLSQFVVGSMSEKQLRAVLMVQAAKQEREVVFSLWRPERIQERWRHWLEERQTHDNVPADGLPERVWVHRLGQALALAIPVSCPLPTRPMPGDADDESRTDTPTNPTNTLPPPLFFVYPTLLYIQNYLQALVIAATLRSLVRLPTQQLHRPSTDESDQESFMARLWTLLRTEIDEQPGSGETKLVNLADEVIRVRRRFTGSGDALDPDEEARLRAAVDRTLQPHDPVFALLQKRLLAAIAERLAHPAETLSPRSSTMQLPERLQTGRGQPGKRPTLGLALDHDAAEDARAAARSEQLMVKGFEDEVLVKAVGEGLSKLRSCVEWTERVWSDLIKTGAIASSA
ncbi:uncharacterized protein B0H18DRAFT_887516 [Fomitopsis serialis]|uniref:uncharacterized protein n=1 Tax=Fomitopsis serialis TaxID=139415 RepID=UPI0020074BFE|nr:uncharacterized protein B0H18DRAFT_887516 [Neoantrodia serialis]KAH9914015.1 hypothetical protein B0H18DRAFT_887516 [Neoantrodia serialis]